MIRKLFIISLIWAILILILSSIPGGSLPKSSLFLNIPHLDKIIHAGLYLPLAFFIVAEFDLSKRAVVRLAGPFLTMLIVSFYGGLIEILQGSLFSNRSADIVDFLADVIGGLIGLTIYFLFFRPFFHKLSEPKS